MPNSKYITAETFEHMVKNQDILIGVLNHSISEIKQDMKEVVKSLSKFVTDFSEVKGSFIVIKRMVWIILTIMGTLAVAGVMAG